MELYLLKFSGCLLAFMSFYKLFLERESFHQLKRFYLLAILALSLTIPLITFTDYIENVPLETIYTATSSEIIVQETMAETSWRDYIPQMLGLIYGMGVIIFSFRFAKHLRQLYIRIKTNPKLKDQHFTNVLLSQSVNPHTFFKYLFFNKTAFENNLIPKEVVLHEQTHAKQLHALDTIIIELLQILFWFHPLLYFIKKDIKLNHEFLADQSVLREGAEAHNYQKLLLAFSSTHSHRDAQEHQLANAINYSSIKKRLTVMKTDTSKTRTWVKSFILLPLLAVLVYGFSSQKIEYISTEKSTSSINPPIELQLDAQGTLYYNNKKINVEDLATIQPLEDEMNVSIETTFDTSQEVTKSVSTSIIKYLRAQGLKGFGVCTTATADANIVNNTDHQEEASKKQIADYNTLAKKYNDMPKNNMSVLLSDVKRIKYLYNLMSYQQRKDAEPFPDFPPPPPAPEAPKAANLENIAPPPPPTNSVNTQNAIVRKGEITNIPPPPPPVSPLDHVIDMAKKNAVFYLEGKKISSDKAIDVLKKNKHLTIETKGSDSKQPEVYITKKGVSIKKKRPSQKTGFLNVNGKKLYYTNIDNVVTYYNRYGVITDKKGNELHPNKQTDANDVLPNSKISKVYYNDKMVSEFKNDDSTILPPPPPEDISMLELANKGAIFYYEDKAITGKKAIELTDTNKNLNILIRDIDSKKPIVKLSKYPINI